MGALWDEGGTGNLNTLRVCRFVLSAPMLVTSIYVNVTNTSYYYTAYTKAFLYADNGSDYPGTLLAESSVINIQSNGWIQFAIPATYLPGDGTTKYWIGTNAAVNETPIERVMFDPGTDNQFYRIDGYYGGTTPLAPAQFPSGATGSAKKASAYVTGTQIRGMAKAIKAILPDNQATFQSVSFYCHTTGFFRLAIYRDPLGDASSKIWESNNTAAVAGAWNTVTISSGIPASLVLNSGTYWLAWQWYTTDPGPSFSSGSAGNGNFIPWIYGSFPSTWTNGTSTAENWSMYATYCSPISVSALSTNVQCYGGSDGTITITASGGTPPYQYSVLNGIAGSWQSSREFDHLLSGVYKIMVMDANGCLSPPCTE